MDGLLCTEFADKISMFAVLKHWLSQLRETEATFLIIYITLTVT